MDGDILGILGNPTLIEFFREISSMTLLSILLVIFGVRLDKHVGKIEKTLSIQTQCLQNAKTTHLQLISEIRNLRTVILALIDGNTDTAKRLLNDLTIEDYE